MKLVTAEEARGLTKPKDDPLGKAIDAVNKRIKERAGMGQLDALIGYTGETEIFSSLSPTERNEIASALKMAGFTVKDGPAPRTIKLHWGEATEEED